MATGRRTDSIAKRQDVLLRAPRGNVDRMASLCCFTWTAAVVHWASRGVEDINRDKSRNLRRRTDRMKRRTPRIVLDRWHWHWHWHWYCHCNCHFAANDHSSLGSHRSIDRSIESSPCGIMGLAATSFLPGKARARGQELPDFLLAKRDRPR